MRGIHFQMPADSDASIHGCCDHTHVVGVDRMPWPSHSDLHGNILTIRRDGREGCSVRLPRNVAGFGEVVLRTACLMQRDEPYRVDVELCRGRMTQIRNQLAAWESEGWSIGMEQENRLRQTLHLLQKAVMAADPEESQRWASECLKESLWLGEEIALLRARDTLRVTTSNGHARRADIGCGVGEEIVDEREIRQLAESFDHLVIPVHWRRVETQKGEYQWDRLERQIEAARQAKVSFSVGPIVDFRPGGLPDWLCRWQNDPKCLATLMIDFVESCVGRFKDRVPEWETTAGSNTADIARLSEDQLLWLTRRLVEATQDIDPYAKDSLSIGQPWGEYLANGRRCYSPFTFVDALLRSDLTVSGLNLEIAMGFPRGGSYCRDLLEFSEILDLYAKLEIPLRVLLSFPSGESAEQEAASAGQWHGSPTPETQADWLENFMSVALSKPRVERVTWGNYRDSDTDGWPLGGVVAASGEPKPSLERLRTVQRYGRSFQDG